MNPPSSLVCWKCGATLSGEPLPLARSAMCRGCNADLHVCRMCQFYEPRWRRGCKEEHAEEVKDRERANFCDYFKPRPDAYQAADDSANQNSKAQLNELFGLGSAESADRGDAKTKSDRAREDLEKLFGIDGKGKS